jgi:hypothetical protein
MLTAAVSTDTPVAVSFSSGCTIHFLYLLAPEQLLQQLFK